uniref:Uncharacterized protein n=1 Tax=Noctiluca scintillans TaxID=2966 RepID=A0A7S1AFJ1_NOCSC|mmetsp:Transcript_44320/g.117556  ORF Transcript_44320/g.117556 Transcript_44320/m.117556 type:complete len:157 (+) Transcript_44320:125-595(+)
MPWEISMRPLARAAATPAAVRKNHCRRWQSGHDTRGAAAASQGMHNIGSALQVAHLPQDESSRKDENDTHCQEKRQGTRTYNPVRGLPAPKTDHPPRSLNVWGLSGGVMCIEDVSAPAHMVPPLPSTKQQHQQTSSTAEQHALPDEPIRLHVKRRK